MDSIALPHWNGRCRKSRTNTPNYEAIKFMGWFNKNRERERFYLLAGMGGRAARRKHQTILKWSIVIGVLVSAALAVGLYLVNRPGQ